MYHLVKKDERLKALQEAFRVLKPKGIFISAYISRFTSFIDGLRSGYIEDPEFRTIILKDLETSHHTNPSNKPEVLYRGDHPMNAKSEVESVGFLDPELIAVDSIWMTEKCKHYFSIDETREHILRFLEKIEKEECIVGASSHYFIIAKKG